MIFSRVAWSGATPNTVALLLRAIHLDHQPGGVEPHLLDVTFDGIAGGAVGGLHLLCRGIRLGRILRSLGLALAEQLFARFLDEVKHTHDILLTVSGT